MRISYDRGKGWELGRRLGIHFGPGSGYLRDWWVALNAGPGQATSPGHDCGHKGLKHCNSCHCHRPWCKSQRWPVFGWVFLHGHSLYVWLGPTYMPDKLTLAAIGTWYKWQWRATLNHLKSRRKMTNGDSLYKLISFA